LNIDGFEVLVIGTNSTHIRNVKIGWILHEIDEIDSRHHYKAMTLFSMFEFDVDIEAADMSHKLEGCQSNRRN